MIGKKIEILRKNIYITLLLVFLLFPVVFVKADTGVYEFNYTGEYQTFVVPSSGTYKLETWGAQAGYLNDSSEGGLGGYASGLVYLKRGDILYVYVGTDGGTTDIRFVSGEWNSESGLKSRLIFAGGGDPASDSNWYGDVCNSNYNQSFCNGNGGSNFTWNEHTKVYVPTGYSVSDDYFMTSVSYESGVREGDGFAKISIVALDGITNIQINNGSIPIDFSYDVYEYNVTINNNIENISFDIVPEEGFWFSQGLSGENFVMPDFTDIRPYKFYENDVSITNPITLTDSNTGVVQVYKVNIKKQRSYLNVDRSDTNLMSEYFYKGPYEYTYTGTYEKFYAPETGTYILEAWGAQGGHLGDNNGGKGGYSKAEMYLQKGEVLYIYVGGSGSTLSQDGITKGWNGGGHTVSEYNAGGERIEHEYLYGGGATDIRYGGNTLYNRVLVAGGGGSVGSTINSGGSAGIAANSGLGTGGQAGTLSFPGANAGFGYGGNGLLKNNDIAGGAGGGGWYGGGGINPGDNVENIKGGGGGSGFAFTSENSQYVPSGYLVTEEHYLTSAVLMNGDETFVSPSGETETGHTGDGYVKITPKPKKEENVYEFNYTGDYQTFVVPSSGLYKLETFGAQGGSPDNFDNGGMGGYASGLVYLNRGDVLYVYVGGNGKTHQGWNGGGLSDTAINEEHETIDFPDLYGGGATDIRFVSGEWNSEEGLKSRLIVAGGGGSANSNGKYSGGTGGLKGNSGSGPGRPGVGASISGITCSRCGGPGFGYGGEGLSINASTALGHGAYGGGAGGGGWYGGGAWDYSAGNTEGGSAGGGSSFTWNEQTKVHVPEGYSVSEDYFMTSVRYSSYANTGDGYAKITAISVDAITDIQINDGEIPIDFAYDIYEYNLTVDNNMGNVIFNVSVEDGYDLTQSNRSIDMTNSLSMKNVIILTDKNTGIIQTYIVNIRKQNDYLEDGNTQSYGYSYTGNYEKFYVPTTGVYILETWGAQGGHRGRDNGGKGGYSKAQMYLQEGEVIYIYVGGSGSTLSQDGTSKGWNGGGHSIGAYDEGGQREEYVNLYGGGATDIRYGGNTLYNRVLVAGGGGSVANGDESGGAAGVSFSSYASKDGQAGTLSGPGSYNAGFGYGGNGLIRSRNDYGGSGGGGWYGGGGANSIDYPYTTSYMGALGGGGGSNYAFTSENSQYAPTGYLVTEENYLKSAVLMNGDQTFTSPEGIEETGHAGDGYARLTYTNLAESIYLVDLNVSTGLDQTFDKETLEYTKLTSDREITIIPTLETEFSSYTITDANGNVIDSFPVDLQLGENVFFINVTAKNGDIGIYKITIVRELADIISFEVEDEIYLFDGDDYQIEITYNPEYTDYKQLTYTVADDSILTVSDDGVITPLNYGDTTITVTSVRNPSLTKTIDVHIVNTMFESDVYDIVRVTEDDEIDYIIGVEPKTKIKDFLANFNNDQEYLRVFTFDGEDVGEEITDLEQNIGTTMAVMLMIEDEVFDGALVVVRGDLNGDGYVTVADQTAVKNMILGKLEKNFLNIKAADVTMEGMITVADMTKVKNHILGKVPSLNE